MRTLTPLWRRAPRIALPVVLAAAGLTAATPSSAGPVVGEGKLVLTDKLDGSGYYICVEGEVTPSTVVAGTWALVISGVRFDDREPGDVWTIDPEPWFSAAFSVDHCEPVDKLGYPNGTFTVDFSYTAASDTVAVHSWGVGAWSPSTGQRRFSVDLTPPAP